MSVVPNLFAPLVNDNKKVIPPWNSFFQQFTQEAPAAVNISNETTFIPNKHGTLFINSGNPGILITRGNITINLGGQKIIPISIGDILTFSGAYDSYFFESW